MSDEKKDIYAIASTFRDVDKLPVRVYLTEKEKKEKGLPVGSLSELLKTLCICEKYQKMAITNPNIFDDENALTTEVHELEEIYDGFDVYRVMENRLQTFCLKLGIDLICFQKNGHYNITHEFIALIRYIYTAFGCNEPTPSGRLLKHKKWDSPDLKEILYDLYPFYVYALEETELTDAEIGHRLDVYKIKTHLDIHSYYKTTYEVTREIVGRLRTNMTSDLRDGVISDILGENEWDYIKKWLDGEFRHAWIPRITKFTQAEITRLLESPEHKKPEQEV